MNIIKRKNTQPKPRGSAMTRAMDRLKQSQQEKQRAEADWTTTSTGTETFYQHATCNKTGAPFVVVYQRRSADALFTVTEVLKTAVQEGGRGRGSGSALPQKTYPISAFDHSGRHCPHCGADGGFVMCTCGITSCPYGTYQRSGITRYRHHACGLDSTLQDATTLSGQSHKDAGSGTSLVVTPGQSLTPTKTR